MRIKNIIVGLVILLFTTNLGAQERHIKEILIDYIAMDIEFPISMDSVVFNSTENENTMIVDVEKLTQFQHGLHQLIPLGPEYTNIDIRRKITVIYSDGKKEILYADYNLIRYKGKIYLYHGVLRSIIEESIICHELDRCDRFNTPQVPQNHIE